MIEAAVSCGYVAGGAAFPSVDNLLKILNFTKMNRIYLMPAVRMIDVACETGFAVSDSLNDAGKGTGDVTIGYGGYDNEFE